MYNVANKKVDILLTLLAISHTPPAVARVSIQTALAHTLHLAHCII